MSIELPRSVPIISHEILDLLEESARLYNQPTFVQDDPISVPHRFNKAEDIEIAGFYSALFAWGKRTTSIRKANELMRLMDDAPYSFHMESSEAEYRRFDYFAHRTFQSVDVPFFVKGIQSLLIRYGSLERAFASQLRNHTMKDAIRSFRNEFLSIPHLPRIRKHLADPQSGSAAKRFNLYLRWMVRKDKAGVDLGIWDDVSPSQLMCPLDVHSGRVARRLGILNRRENDWDAVEEVSSSLRIIDPVDPIRFDFALFGLGIFEKF